MNDVIGVGKKLNSAKSSSRVMVMCGRSADSWYASTILQGGVVLGWRRNSATGRLFNSEFTHCFVQSGLRLFPSSRDGLSGQDTASGTLFTLPIAGFRWITSSLTVLGLRPGYCVEHQ